MEIRNTTIPGLLLIQPKIFGDERGYFFESYQQEKFRHLGIDVNFIQDNESRSAKGVLRGLHFQAPPYAQGKLVRVVRGAVWDVAVDIRKESPTYGKWQSVRLDENSKTMLYVPEGFAHGFLTLEDDTIFQYKCTNYFNKESQMSILWNDPDLLIDWGTNSPILSGKDAEAPLFKDFISPF